jgi:platelet-activating factor acetylhydrolase IB subunit alpha
VEFTPNGEQLLSASRDKTVKVWDLTSGYCLKTLSGHTDWVKRVACNLYGTVIASSSKDSKIILWDLGGKSPIINSLESHEHVIDSIRFANIEACKVIQESDYFKTEMLHLIEEPEGEETKAGANNE